MHRRPLRQFDRMLDQLSDKFDGERVELGDGVGTTAVDVAEKDGEYVVIADLPGFDPDDIDVRVSDRTLTISAEHKTESEPDVEEYHKRERAYRSVSRSVRLPGEIDAEDVSASYDDGVLSVTLPKENTEEDADGRRIEIE